MKGGCDMQDYRKLQAWQKSHALALRTYAVTANFPKDEMFSLTSQMRRAAVSIPANLAEGCYRDSRRSLAQAVRISLGSAAELEYYAILAADLNLLPDSSCATFAAETVDVKRVLSGFLRAIVATIDGD
jgi:four helix bundle protein